MFRKYESVDRPGAFYRPLSRYIKLRPESTGEGLYFIFNNRRIGLNSLDYLTWPEMVRDKDGKTIVIGLYETLCNWGARLYEIHPDGEYIRVWEEVQS